LQLNDPDLLKEESYIDAKWVGAKSGKRFEILGKRDVHNSETVHAKDGDENGKTPVIFLGRDGGSFSVMSRTKLMPFSADRSWQ